MSTYSGYGTRQTRQTEKIPGSAQQPNNAGGFSYTVDDFSRLERFLVLGSVGGTYYVGEHKLTKDNAECVTRCLDADPVRAIKLIRDVSVDGRGISNDEAIFALALASGHPDVATRQFALGQLPLVCRTGTHLFQFCELVEQFRGWGRSLRRAVAKWYAEKPAEKLAYQLIKYRQRDGWATRDPMRLAHPARRVSSGNPTVEISAEQALLLGWAAGNAEPDELHVRAFLAAQGAKTPKDTIALLERYGNALPREAINTDHLKDPGVNAALLDAGMPMTALIRNLGNLTRHGVLKPLDDRTTRVCNQLVNRENLKAARVHPMTILFALATYRTGRGFRGTNTWSPLSNVVNALDDAFYLAFDNVEPAGKRFLLGLDVSGSMDYHMCGESAVSCMQAAMAMSLVTDRTEPSTHIFAFDNGMRPVTISSRQRLDDAIASLPRNRGGTDCSLPMLYALQNGLEVDVFAVYTDSETYAGSIHPMQALRQYREKTGINAKLVVVGMAATEFTIADPNDVGSLDVVGMDPSVPGVISNFARN